MIKGHQQFDLFNKKVFEKAVIEPPFRIMADMPNEACFYYVVQGEAAVLSASGSAKCLVNEGFVLKCGTYFNEYFARSTADYCEAIAIHFYPEVLKMIYDRELPDFLNYVKKLQPVRFEHIPASSMLANYIESLQFYFNNPALVSDELLKLKLKELILLLAKTDNVQTILSLLNGLFTSFEIDFKEVIESNLYNDLSLEELAILSGHSLSTFKREFKRHYHDQPPAKYIKNRRLLRAAELLKATSLRISDIAFDCGFKDLAHFSKSFQKKFGSPPSYFRNGPN